MPNDIRFGPTIDYGNSVTAAAPDPLPVSSVGPFWEAQLTGLAAGATYHYSIGGGLDHTFRTAPTGNFRFDVIADIGDSVGSSRVAPTQAAIAADDPAFVLASGDLTYGNVKGQAAVDQHFNDMMAWSQTAAYMPAWGNHELDLPDDMRNYKGRFAIPNDHASPGAPASGCCGEDWGWFDAGGVRFISYPEPMPGAWADWQTQADQIMAAAQTDPAINFIVTWGHRPAYSTGLHPGDATLAGTLNGLGDAYSKYVLNLNGHSHDYERFQPMHGVVHVTAAGGGASLESPWTSVDPRTIYRAMHFEHLRVDVTATSIHLEAVCGPASTKDDITCSEGSVIDSATIGQRAPDTSPAAALSVSPPSGQAPVEVTADASASTDTDATPIQSYTFDFGDGTAPVGPQPGPVARHTYSIGGDFTVKVTATDTQGFPGSATAPVQVSPPPGPPSTVTYTFSPAADATIDKINASINYGANARVVVDNSPVDDFLLRFNVNASPCQSVTAATLRLGVTDGSVKGGDFYTAGSGWAEGSVNWSNAPARGTFLNSLGAVSAGNTYTVNVTSGVSTTNGGVSFRVGTTSSDGARYYSKEGGTAGQRPQLTVTCTP